MGYELKSIFFVIAKANRFVDEWAVIFKVSVIKYMHVSSVTKLKKEKTFHHPPPLSSVIPQRLLKQCCKFCPGFEMKISKTVQRKVLHISLY